MPLVTAPLHEEHAELRPRIDGLLSLADRIGEIDPDDLRRELYEASGFLTKHLMPHAIAEERVLYPKVAQLLGASAATATMSRDHVEFAGYSEELEALRVRLSDADPNAEDERALRRLLYGLHALLRRHFATEEEIYLPLLEERLSPEEAAEVVAAMEATARDLRQTLR